MSSDRRTFLRSMLRAGAGVAGVLVLPEQLRASVAGITAGSRWHVADPDPIALGWRAVETARAAGAAYADVRLTYDRRREVSPDGWVSNDEGLRAGVRALVDGYWGFAGSPYWSPDEMARLASEAVAQAKTNVMSGGRTVDLGAIPIVKGGEWTTPVVTDPLDVPLEEVWDFLDGLDLYLKAVPHAQWDQLGCNFLRQDKVFASTEGASYTQIVYATVPRIVLGYSREMNGEMLSDSRDFDFLEPATKGWELIKGNERRILNEIPRLIAEMEEDARLPKKPVEVGRYEVVFDGRGVSRLVAQTLGCATQLDRALGYEANATGTGYITDPHQSLGTYLAGAPLLTVTGNRSLPGGLATVRWDDEGVEPDEITLIKDGVLTDFQTTRESASWLKDHYAKQGRAARSHGCAATPTAVDPPLQHPPNLTMAPAEQDRSLDDLLADTTKGYLIRNARAGMDFQCLNGMGGGTVFELKGGRRVARITGAGFLFRAPELWRSLEAIGGPSSAGSYATGTSLKGEPEQEVSYTVTAVPAKVKQVAIIDRNRKA